MEKEEELMRGRKKAMSLLNHSDRTRWELEDRMERAGFSEEVIADAIAYVEGFRYIDDLRYAQRFAEIYRETRSIARIRQDLKKRHVPEEYIEMALEEIEYDDSQALARELGKLCRNSRELSYQERQKIAAKLYRRGFATEDIFRAMADLDACES